jgi:hypothetical protein
VIFCIDNARVMYTKNHCYLYRYLYIKRNVEKVCGARYTLGARYLSKNAVFTIPPETPCIFIFNNNNIY